MAAGQLRLLLHRRRSVGEVVGFPELVPRDRQRAACRAGAGQRRRRPGRPGLRGRQARGADGRLAAPKYVCDLPERNWRPFLQNLDASVAGVVDGARYVAVTDHGAPRGRIVAISFDDPDPAAWAGTRPGVRASAEPRPADRRPSGRHGIGRRRGARLGARPRDGRELEGAHSGRGALPLARPAECRAGPGRPPGMAPTERVRYRLSSPRTAARWPSPTSAAAENVGTGWADAGRLSSKQNSLDDLYAIGEHLVATGVTAAGRLAATGWSNGGWLAPRSPSTRTCGRRSWRNARCSTSSVPIASP